MLGGGVGGRCVYERLNDLCGLVVLRLEQPSTRELVEKRVTDRGAVTIITKISSPTVAFSLRLDVVARVTQLRRGGEVVFKSSCRAPAFPPLPPLPPVSSSIGMTQPGVRVNI